MSWNGHELEKDYRPIEPAKKIDMMTFALNCGPTQEGPTGGTGQEGNTKQAASCFTFRATSEPYLNNPKHSQ
jgi:hypothetical protein